MGVSHASGAFRRFFVGMIASGALVGHEEHQHDHRYPPRWNSYALRVDILAKYT